MTITEALFGAPSLADELGRVAERLRASVVVVRDGGRGAGAGVVWSADGLVVTNDHVVRGEEARLTLPGGAATGRVVARDRDDDLALLRVDRADLTPAAVADARDLRVGQLVLAVGHPLGVEGALTLGIVSRLPRPSDERELVTANLLLNPGNSGGALADIEGRLVGINAMVGGPGLALAVPSHVVQAFVARAVGPKRYLGIEARPARMPERQARRHGLALPAGLVVTGIEAGSPAEASGLMLGDVVVAVGGRPVRTARHLAREIALANPAAPLRLTVLRGDERQEVLATLVLRT